jgi:superfamily I DNA/RNA helicase
MSEKTWSTFQNRIFTFGTDETGNAVVIAVAGSGKTTTMVELMKRVNGSKIFLAFNKKNAEDLASRGVNGKTFHSVCYSPVTRARKARNVDANKMYTVINDRLGDEEARIYGPFLQRLVGLGKNAGIGALVDDSEQEWLDLVNHHGLEIENERGTVAQGVKYASMMLQASNASPLLDFDDLLYLAVKDGISLPKFDFIVVDEAQDTNVIQRAVIRKMMHDKTRLVAVGDPAQAIYGFRGADSQAIYSIKEEFNAIELPLTVSYRCPKAVVRHAQRWVSHIQANDGAAEGSVTSLEKFSAETFQPQDMVVCRTTAPVVRLAFKLLQKHIPATVLGRDIGAGLKSLVNRMKAKGIPALENKINEWRVREIEKANAKRQEAAAEAIADKADAVLFLIDSLPETTRTVPALLALIDNLFADKANAVVLCTIHKSKGAEARRVFWLNSSKMPAKWAKQEWEQEQERNLCYVATTRAMEDLILIEDSGYTDASSKPQEK